eukprot:NODE_10720_length_192_cov_3.244755_g10637_i0.p1 GENE.NODE_10720_length_192_cov_3.244755_g10637_i0~~NODE_10720_length_192_cov_3.244755_g10637_i0.p1  ORF type:complete len:57 (+),score=18.03 NODE_10720_length_192_cov_3.244755_g10637_i0:25-171(+)
MGGIHIEGERCNPPTIFLCLYALLNQCKKKSNHMALRGGGGGQKYPPP